MSLRVRSPEVAPLPRFRPGKGEELGMSHGGAAVTDPTSRLGGGSTDIATGTRVLYLCWLECRVPVKVRTFMSGGSGY